MLVRILIVVVIVLAAVLIFAATRPDTFRVQRATSIKAPPEKIFALIDDFHNWGSWSPYEKLDPAMKRTQSGAASGKGAVYEWQGDSKVGQGRMEITDSSAPSKVVIKLDFIRPFEGHNVVTFLMEPRGEATNVTWDIDDVEGAEGVSKLTVTHALEGAAKTAEHVAGGWSFIDHPIPKSEDGPRVPARSRRSRSKCAGSIGRLPPPHAMVPAVV
jgi:uncharacterized protein YndB with AHSA1/START domain